MATFLKARVYFWPFCPQKKEKKKYLIALPRGPQLVWKGPTTCLWIQFQIQQEATCMV